MFIINQYLVVRVHQMWQDHYNNMAMRIQAVWRGYWSRKTKINFLQFQRWLKNVYIKNTETLENMQRYAFAHVLLYAILATYFIL